MVNPSIVKIMLVSCLLIGCSSDNPSTTEPITTSEPVDTLESGPIADAGSTSETGTTSESGTNTESGPNSESGTNSDSGSNSDSGTASEPETVTEPTTTFINQDDHTYYEQVLSSDSECITDGVFNCTADLYLCKDGSAYLLLTDIINAGTYVDSEDKIETSWNAFDVPSQVNFVKQADRTLIDDALGFIWSKAVSESVASWCGS